MSAEILKMIRGSKSLSIRHCSESKPSYTLTVDPGIVRMTWGEGSHQTYSIDEAVGYIRTGVWIVESSIAPDEISPDVISRIKRLSELSTTDNEFGFKKLVEELGEVSTAMNQPHRCSEPLQNELVDVIIVAMDMLFKVAKSDTAINIDSIFMSKLDKWASKAGIQE